MRKYFHTGVVLDTVASPNSPSPSVLQPEIKQRRSSSTCSIIIMGIYNDDPSRFRDFIGDLERLSVPRFNRQENEDDHCKPDTASGQPEYTGRLVGDILLSGEGGDDLR